MDEFYRAIKNLPEWLSRPLEQLPAGSVGRVHELRLRTGCGITLTLCGKQCPIASVPGCPPELARIRLNQLQMEEVFYALCGGSLHTHQAELLQGYITTSSGCRVGVAGRYAQLETGEIALQQVHSLNIRIARPVSVRLPLELVRILQTKFTGMLILGEPGSGKTTILRQIAVLLAESEKTVAVIDERGELFPEGWSPSFSLDRLSGIDKAKALQIALRTLSPQIILLDELGGMREVLELEQGFFGGVALIATAHASDLKDAERRPQIRYMCQQGMLRAMVFLQGREAPGQINEVQIL